MVGGPIDSQDLYHWRMSFIGPIDSPYEGGQFHIDVKFPSDYPYRPPKCAFLMKVYHPNVKFDTGAISIDILRDQWSPALTCRTIILSIINLMIEPDPDDPLEPEIAALYSLNRPRYSLNAY